jgi:putative transcriptional regulator
MLAMGHLLPLIALATATMAAQDNGAVLVATEASHDTDFARTVVLVLDHDAHRATGLVLNRPVKISLAEVFPELKAGPALGQTAWAGGPVLLGVNALLRARSPRAGLDRVLPGVYLIADKRRIRAEIVAGTPAASFRVYLGVCGWGAGQLESEIKRGLWRIVPGSADPVFDAKPDTLWERLRRTAPQAAS